MIADTTSAWFLPWTLACALLPIVVCIGAGAGIGRGRSRWPGADMLVGFGLVGTALTILAVTTRIPLSRLMAGLAGAAVIAPVIGRQLPGGRSTWIALALITPILVVAAGGEPAMWDDFWNWLPSAAYAYVHDSLPWPDLPPSLSIFPGYPQGLPLMVAAASFVSGRWLEAAGPVINVALLAGSSAVFAEALAATLVRHGRLPAKEAPPVVLIAGAVAITTLLNPGLDGAVLLSSYADCGTMVAVGALALLGVEMLARQAAGTADVDALAWRFGFVGAMLIGVKQANPVLLALITAGLALVALRDPALRTWGALRQLPRMLGPAIIPWGVWRWYVAHNLTHAEHVFRPLDSWNFDALDEIFASIGRYITEAPLFHAVMWSVAAAGVILFFRSPRGSSEARWLAVICATVWLGYNAFLVIVYLGDMTNSDARIAADYWRFTPHTALLGLYPPVMALALARWPASINLRGAIPTLAAIALALCALPLRRDLNHPADRPWQHFLRETATDIGNIVPPQSKLLIVPVENSSPFAVAVRYHLWHLDKPEQRIDSTIVWEPEDYPDVASWAARGEAVYLLIQDAEGNMDEQTDRLGLPRLNHELVLYDWRDGAWQKVKSWPVPPVFIRREP
jgi:hypothetical protein